MADEDPSRFDPRTDASGRKETNSLIWGAVVAVVIAAVVALSSLYGVKQAGLLETNPGAAVGGGFFFGWAAAEIKNWLGRRRPKL